MAILPPDPVYILRGKTTVHSLLFRVSPYIEHLYTGTEDGVVHVWDLQKSRQIFKLSDVTEPCISLHNMDDECLVTQRKGGLINFWKPNGSTWILNNTIDTDYCGFCRCKPQSEDIIYIPLKNSRVGLLSLKTSKTEVELHTSKIPGTTQLGDVMALKPVANKDELLLVCYESGQVALWDVKANNVLSWLKTNECPMTIDFNHSLRHGIIGNPTDKLEIFEMLKTQELSLKTLITVKNPGTSVVTSRPDAKVFTAGGWDGRLRIFSWKTLRPLAILNHHKDTIHDIIYSTSKVETYNSKCLMAASGESGDISLWDLYN